MKTVSDLLGTKRSLEIKFFILIDDEVGIFERYQTAKEVVDKEQLRYPDTFITAKITNLKTNDVYLIFSGKMVKLYKLSHWGFLQQDGKLFQEKQVSYPNYFKSPFVRQRHFKG